MDFLTGFSNCQGTRPGARITKKSFNIVFKEVFCNATKNSMSAGFECCYDWSPVMKLLLKVLQEEEEVEERGEEEVQEWLASFPGWGLLASCLPLATQQHLLGRMEEVRSLEAGLREAYSRVARERGGFRYIYILVQKQL